MEHYNATVDSKLVQDGHQNYLTALSVLISHRMSTSMKMRPRRAATCIIQKPDA